MTRTLESALVLGSIAILVAAAFQKATQSTNPLPNLTRYGR